MKKKIFLLFLLMSPLIVVAQNDSASNDTLILDKFFHYVGKHIKKAVKKSSDRIRNRPIVTYSKRKLMLGFEITYLSSFCEDEEFFGNNYVLPAVTLNFRRNYLSLGPKFNFYDIGEKDFGKPGIQLSYQINPFKENKFLTFYFQYNFGVLRNKHNFFTQYWNGTALIKTPASVTSTSIENVVGYGISLSICKGLYLYQNLGVGMVWIKDYYRYAAREISSGYRTNIAGVYQFTAGLGYRLVIRK